MVFSFVNNTSIGSNCFMDFSNFSGSGSPTSVTGNRIIEPTGPWAIRLNNGGPYFVANNVIKSRPGQAGPVVEMTWGNQTFVGNTYTVQYPVKQDGRFLRINDDKLVDPATISSEPPVLPSCPPRRARKVFEIAAGADAATIQAAIDSAAALAGQRPVVHLATGLYQIAGTLTIPAGCDVQLVGDGAGETVTVLQWTGPEGGTLLHLVGPSVATVRDMMIEARSGNCLLVDNADQPGGRIFTDQLNAYGWNAENQPAGGVLVNGLEQSDVLMSCLQGATDCQTWVKVVGGPMPVAGQGPLSQVSILCAAGASPQLADYAVEKGGRLVVRSAYHEKSGNAPQAILLNDAGMLAIDACRFSFKTSLDKPLIGINNFRGSFALLTSQLIPVNSDVTDRLEITGNGADAKVLIMGEQFYLNELGVNSDKVFLNNANPPAKAALLQSNMSSNLEGAVTGPNGIGYLEDRGEADPQWAAQMVQPLLTARVWLPGAAPAGATNLQLHRVICRSGKDMVGVEFRAGR